MPACPPDRLIASTPMACSAMTISALDCVSPVLSSTSISRASGCSVIWCASAISASVVSPIADTTATTRSPACTRRLMRAATFLMRAASATELPPYFWTTRAMSLLREAGFFAGKKSAGASVPPAGCAATVERNSARRVYRISTTTAPQVDTSSSRTMQSVGVAASNAENVILSVAKDLARKRRQHPKS